MGICLIIKSGGGIDTSAATATADKILSGHTIYSNDNKVTGSMTNIGAQTESGKGVSSSTTIKAGWHDGTGKISTSELKSQMAATTVAVGDVLNGYTYWTNGSNSKYTGTMTNRGKKEWKLGINGTQTIESGWHDGNGTVSQSLSVDNNECWRTPSTVQQQVCWANVYYSKVRGCYGSSSLTAANIKKGITIFGVKGTYSDARRFIIQDGQYNSLLGGYLWFRKGNASLVADQTITYNNATWRLVCGEKTYRWDEDSSTSTYYQCYTAVPNITKWMSVSWNYSEEYGRYSKISHGGILRGDMVIPTVQDGNSGLATWENVRFSINVRIKLASGTGDGIGYMITTGIGYCWGKYNTFSVPAPGNSNGMTSSIGSGLALNTYVIDIWGKHPANNVPYGAYARNLWIDTSTPVS